MTDYRNHTYIGTILLEVNRHKPIKEPTIRVSEWLDRFAAAGFEGMELWENHALMAPDNEVDALESAAVPVAVLNSYATFTDADREATARAADMVKRLGAAGVKFNFPRDASLGEEAIRNVSAWRDELPEGVRALCECHPGTIAEEPDAAAAIFDRLGRDRFEVIVHAFSRPESLRAWFQRLGPMVTHVHVQLRDDENLPIRLDRRPEFVEETIHVLREEGFVGSFTLEFTEGTNRPGENVTGLWRNAVLDLAYLRSLL